MFIPIVSANTERAQDGYVFREWHEAAERARSILGRKFIVPVIIDDDYQGDPSRYRNIPYDFRDLHFGRAPGGDPDAVLLAKLTQEIRAMRRSGPAVTGPRQLWQPQLDSENPRLDSDNPWPGLEAITENEREFFFGRDREATLLLSHVLDAPVTVLYGRSGLGKTSLLRAGLFPKLREHNSLPVYIRLEPKPGAAPLSFQLRQVVHDAIRAHVPDARLLSEDETLWEYLHRKDFELWSARNYLLTPVMILDQFEELFTLGERVPELVRTFMNDLGDLAENRIPADLTARIDNDEAVAERFDLSKRNYKLLISLREDYLPISYVESVGGAEHAPTA